MTEFARNYREFITNGTSFQIPNHVRNRSTTPARFRRRVVESLAQRCINRAPVICEDCTTIFDVDDEGITVNDLPICAECADGYWYCDYCEEYHSNDDAVLVYDEVRNGRPYERTACERERSDNYTRSWDGEYYPDSTFVDVYGRDNISTLDPECQDLCSCSDCNVLAHYDDAESDDDGDHYCPDCAPARSGSHPYPLLSYHSSSRPRIRHVGKGHVLYGVEIETENSRGRNATLEVCEEFDTDKTHEHYWCEEDGSLDDAAGVEIVTQPHTLAAFREDFWKDFLAGLRASGARAWDASSCGQHIHVSRKAFQGVLHQAKFATFLSMSENRSFVEWVAGRRLQTYAQLPHDADTKTLSQFAGAATKWRIEGDGAKYRVCNLSHRDTIEFRLPKGTLNHRTFLKNLEFVDALRVYTLDASIKQLGAGTFVDWVQGQKKRWPALTSWMKDRAEWQPSDMPGELSLGRVAKLRVKKAEIKEELGRTAPLTQVWLNELNELNTVQYTTEAPAEPWVGMRGITRNGSTYTLAEITTAASDSYPLRWQDAAGDFVQSTRMNGDFWDATPSDYDITQWEVRQPEALSEAAEVNPAAWAALGQPRFTTAQPEHLTVGMLGLTREGRQVELEAVSTSPHLTYPLTWRISDTPDRMFSTTRSGSHYSERMDNHVADDIIHWQVL